MHLFVTEDINNEDKVRNPAVFFPDFTRCH